MDPELIAFLKAEFGSINARLDRVDTRLGDVDTRLGGVETRLGGVETRLGGVDARLDGHDARFKGIDGQFKGMQDQMDSRFDKVEEQNRHTHVLIEDLQSDVQLLAEGHGAQDEKIDRRFDEAETGRKEDRGHLEAMMKATFLQLSRRDDELEERTELVLRSAPE